MAGHQEPSKPIATPVAQWLLSHTKVPYRELAVWQRVAGPLR